MSFRSRLDNAPSPDLSEGGNDDLAGVLRKNEINASRLHSTQFAASFMLRAIRLQVAGCIIHCQSDVSVTTKASALRQTLPNVPPAIAVALEKEFAHIQQRFSRRDWGPSTLNGGRFAEALFRYLEWKGSGGPYTPIGQQLDRSSIASRVRRNAKIPQGVRFHVLSCAELLMDIRNRRDVAHLGPTLDVNEMDSRLVLRLASWALSEIIREEAQLPHSSIQNVIDRLSSKQVSLVEEIDGDLVVVATNLPAKDRALVALYHCYPNSMDIDSLRRATQYKNQTRFRKLLDQEQKDGKLVLIGDHAFLTAKGAAWIEKHIELVLRV